VKTLRVVETVSAGKCDLAPNLLGDHTPAVVFRFVHPTVAMEGLRQLGGVHQRRGGASGTRLTGHVTSVPLRATGCLRARPTPPEGVEPPSRGCPFGLTDRAARTTGASERDARSAREEEREPWDQLRSGFRAVCESRSRSTTSRAMVPIGLLHCLTG